MTSTVALATCSTLPELDADEQLVIEPLRRRGVTAVPAVWNDPTVEWAEFDLVVIRSTWDYTTRHGDFLSWARSVPRLVNPADVVAWNTDKRYLRDLAEMGVPVVATSWISPRDSVALPATGRHVLKPAIGAGSLDAAAFSLHDAREAELARAHLARLRASGQTVMVQPYLDKVEREGETALIYMGGDFSHAVVKGGMLATQRELINGLYMSEEISPRAPSDEQLDLARRALAAVPGGPERLAYARVDLVPGGNGEPLIIELELTEPSLFMGGAPDAAERFAEVIAALVR